MLQSITFLLTLVSAMACRCQVPKLDSSFRNSEAVAKATVSQGFFKNEHFQFYKASTNEVFKNCKLQPELIVKTGSSSASCGVELKPETAYVLMGTLSEEVLPTYDCPVQVLTINSCQYNREWDSLDAREQKFLYKMKEPCDMCSPKDCGPAILAPNFTCPDEETIGGPTNECSFGEKTGKCSWGYIKCPVCDSDTDCQKDQYCAGGECRKDGTCRDTRDCFNPSNDFTIYKRCLYYLECDEAGTCQGICGGSCPDKEPLVQCFKQPCAEPNGCDEKYASCVDDYCGGCNANFYGAKGDPVCEN